MRSTLARIIAIGALLVVLPSAISFLRQTQVAFSFNEMGIIGGSWITLGQALIAPINLFAMAAIVEMLSRISQSVTGLNANDPAPRSGHWPWRSGIAKAFLVVALATYLISSWAVIRYLTGGGAEGAGVPPDQAVEMTFSILFYWLTAPLQIIAWAAVIEYLLRITAALEQRRAQ